MLHVCLIFFHVYNVLEGGRYVQTWFQQVKMLCKTNKAKCDHLLILFDRFSTLNRTTKTILFNFTSSISSGSVHRWTGLWRAGDEVLERLSYSLANLTFFPTQLYKAYDCVSSGTPYKTIMGKKRFQCFTQRPNCFFGIRIVFFNDCDLR